MKVMIVVDKGGISDEDKRRLEREEGFLVIEVVPGRRFEVQYLLDALTP
jgi:hypothetical protein